MKNSLETSRENHGVKMNQFRDQAVKLLFQLPSAVFYGNFPDDFVMFFPFKKSAREKNITLFIFDASSDVYLLANRSEGIR
jgi:hypothetical protein